MSEVNGNNLVGRDGETNAIVPIVQIYMDGMEGKQVSGNRLVIRDPDTNAIIPVVKVQGIVDGGTSLTPEQTEKINGAIQSVNGIFPGENGNVEVEIGITDSEVKNTLGDSTTDAISQKLFTETVNNWNKGW